MHVSINNNEHSSEMPIEWRKRCTDKQMRKTLKKEGRDAEGRMGGGDTEQERKTGAMDMEDCVREAHATVIFKR